MKVCLLLLLGLVLSLTAAGCATPAYSASERNAQILRSWDYSFKELTDDFDNALLLRPSDHQSIWDLR